MKPDRRTPVKPAVEGSDAGPDLHRPFGVEQVFGHDRAVADQRPATLSQGLPLAGVADLRAAATGKAGGREVTPGAEGELEAGKVGSRDGGGGADRSFQADGDRDRPVARQAVRRD